MRRAAPCSRQRGFLLNPYRFGGAPAPGGDPYWSSVSALLKFDSGSGDAVDSGPLGLVLTKGALAAYSVDSKFGPYAGSFPGGETSSFTAGINSAFEFGSGEFTIEGWVKVASTTVEQVLLSMRRTVSGLYSNMVRISPTGRLGWSDGVAWRETVNPVPLNTYFHFAISRAGGVLSIFINGETGYSAANTADLSTARGLVVGRTDIGDSQPAVAFVGLLDEVRITKGVGRYSATFVPPASPFPIGPA